MLPKAKESYALTIPILSKNDVYKSSDTWIDITLGPYAERQIIAEHEKNGSVGILPGTRRKARRDQIWNVQNNVNSARCGWLSGALTIVSLFL